MYKQLFLKCILLYSKNFNCDIKNILNYYYKYIFNNIMIY